MRKPATYATVRRLITRRRRPINSMNDVATRLRTTGPDSRARKDGRPMNALWRWFANVCGVLAFFEIGLRAAAYAGLWTPTFWQ